jgi:hypothetical protein
MPFNVSFGFERFLTLRTLEVPRCLMDLPLVNTSIRVRFERLPANFALKFLLVFMASQMSF